MMKTVYGATRAVWKKYAENGWGSLMLPVVSDPSAQIDPGSKMKQLGKTPSILTPSGTVVGLKGWPMRRVSDEDRAAWASHGYGICIRCGSVAAIDCDVSNPKIAQKILDIFTVTFGSVPIRRRAGSSRWLAVVRVSGGMTKRIATLPSSSEPSKNDAVEVLCTGQQFVAEGTHPSGSRYSWTPEAPKFDDLPEIQPEEIDSFLDFLASEYGASVTKARSSDRPTGKTELEPDPLADWLRSTGRVLDESGGVLHIKCPWEANHTSDSGLSATSYFSRGVNGQSEPGFKCLHAHCADKTYDDFLAWAVQEGYKDPSAADFPELPPLEKADEEQSSLMRLIQSNADPKTGLINATLPTVMAALRLKDFCRVQIAWDSFAACIVYRDIVGTGRPLRGDKGCYSAWAPFGDAESVLMRERLEREFRFKSISKELMRDATIGLAMGGVAVVDTMRDFLSAKLPAWDGVERCKRFFAEYCGAEPCRFASALGRYLFAALYGRAWSVEGVKADITPILIGLQGTYKSSLIAKLAFKPGTFRSINFKEKDVDIKRLLRGQSVIELPEMSGFSRRDADDIKYFLSLKEDSWVPKFWEYAIDVPRRCVFVASTNNMEILSDPTGSRRFAPIETGVIRIDDLDAVIPQLWAEGRYIFETEGIPHKEVEMLAAARSHKFEAPDAWQDAILNWIADQESLPEADRSLITPTNLLIYAIGVPVSRVKPSDTRRVGAILRALGFKQKYVKDPSGKTTRTWAR